MTWMLLVLACFVMPREIRGMQEATDDQKPYFTQLCVINNGKVKSNEEDIERAHYYYCQQVPACVCTQSSLDINAWLKSHALDTSDKVFNDLNEQLLQSRCIHQKGWPTSVGIIELTPEHIRVRWCGDLKVWSLTENYFGNILLKDVCENDSARREFNRFIGCMTPMLDDECAGALGIEYKRNVAVHTPSSWAHIIFTNQLFCDNKEANDILSLSKQSFDKRQAKLVVYRLHSIARNLAQKDSRVSLISVSYKLRKASQERE